MSTDTETPAEWVPPTREDRAGFIVDGAKRLSRLLALKAPEIIIEMERASLMRKITSFPVDSESQAAAWRVKEEMHRDEQDFLFANGYYRDVAGDADDAPMGDPDEHDGQ